MSVLDFFRGFFDKNNEIKSLSTCVFEDDINAKYKVLILEASVNLIANTFARSEFKTFLNAKEHKGTNYYIFNVEANNNNSAFLFWKALIKKLLMKSEALAIIKGNNLYLVDSFDRQEQVFKDNIYSNITIGDTEIPGVKYEKDILYFRYDNKDLRSSINVIYEDFSQLIKSSVKGYQNSKARKGKLKVPTNLPKELEVGNALQNHIAQSMEDFLDPSKDAVYLEGDGFEYTEIAESKGSKSNDSGRETKNFINDVFEFIAIAFSIPPSLLKGDTVDTKDAVNNFLTFCINPIAKLVQDEINRKMYGKNEYLANSYVKVDTTNIKAVDLRDIANSIDLLNRNGALTIDETLRILSKEPLGGEIGEMRFITKNLEVLDKGLKDIKGGD